MFGDNQQQQNQSTTDQQSLLGDAGQEGQQQQSGQQPPPPADAKPDRAALEKAVTEAQGDEAKAAAEKALKDFDDAAKAAEGEPLTVESLPDIFDKTSPLAKEYVDLMNNKEISPADFRTKMTELGTRLAVDFEEKSARMWLDMNQEFQSETIKHFGGEDKLEPVLHKIGSLIDHYDRDEFSKFQAANPDKQPDKPFGKSLRQALTLTGFGNHPEAVKFFNWVAEQLGEGAPLSGAPAGGQKSTAQRLFPNQN